jgi:hypothetical protein
MTSAVLAGAMGMNFWLVVAAMAVLAVGTLVLARLRGWP